MKKNYFIIFIFLFTSNLFSVEKQKLSLEWNPVAGAAGYMVQIEQVANGKIREEKLKLSKIVLELDPGNYRLRVSGLNKFGKPAAWSDWKSIELKAGEAPLSINLSSQEPVKETPKEISKPENMKFNWKMMVPGLIQYQSGKQYKIWLYLSGFTILAGADYSEFSKGNNESNSGRSIANLFTASTLIINQPVLPFYLLNQYEKHKSDYDMHLNHQRVIAGLFIGLYAIHWIDLIYFTDRKGNKTSLEFKASPDLRSGVSGEIRFKFEF